MKTSFFSVIHTLTIPHLPPYKICTPQLLRSLTYLDHLQKKKTEIQLVIQGGVFSSVAQLCLTLCNPMDCSSQASLSITNSRSLLKLMSIESVMPFNHLILCRPLLLLPSIFSSIRVFSNESVLCIR